MNRTNAVRSVLLALALLALAPAARAQQVELQPFIGYRFGGSFDIDAPQASGLEIRDARSYGFTVGLVLNASQQMDFLWSHQDTTLDVHGSIPGSGDTLSGFDVDNFQIEGSYIAGAANDRVRPFAAFGVGATRFGAPAGFSGSRTLLAFSIGGGARVSLGKALGLRFQGRWTPTFFGSDETIYCSSGSGCYATVSGDYVDQFEATAGMTVRF
jgi:hypothetical protein